MPACNGGVRITSPCADAQLIIGRVLLPSWAVPQVSDLSTALRLIRADLSVFGSSLLPCHAAVERPLLGCGFGIYAVAEGRLWNKSAAP
jgi:hypothetical protein